MEQNVFFFLFIYPIRYKLEHRLRILNIKDEHKKIKFV
jgi:hypothetical protein